MDKLLEKLSTVLTKDDLEAFKSDIEATISERVESEKTKSLLLIESEQKEKLAQLLAEEKQKLEETNKKELASLETHIVEQVDLCLERLIDADFKEEIIKSFAVNEALLPIVTGVKEVFGKYVKLDESAETKVAEVAQERDTYKTQLSEAIGEKMKAQTDLIELQKKVYISEKVATLGESQKAAVVNMFSDKEFAFVEKHVDDFIKAITEAKSEKDDEDDKKKKGLEDEKSEKEEKGEKKDLHENKDPGHEPAPLIVENKNDSKFDPEFLKLLNSVL